jgi:hypothetical protein
MPSMHDAQGSSTEATPLLPGSLFAPSLGNLWLQSRLRQRPKMDDAEAQDKNTCAPNQYRPLSLYHFGLAWRLAAFSVPFLLELLLRSHKVALISGLLMPILGGLLPTIAAWSSAKLLIEVQHSLTTGDIRLANIELYAGATIGLALFRLVFRFFEEASQTLLVREMRFLVKSASLSRSNTDRLAADLCSWTANSASTLALFSRPTTGEYVTSQSKPLTQLVTLSRLPSASVALDKP